MSRSFLIFFLSSIAVTGLFLINPQSIKIKKDSADPQGLAVVELFTSEGCSSCPPADEGMAELEKEHIPQVFLLGFHVSYWDHLGWKDPFSNPAYTGRQQQYAAEFGLNSIYTPQVVVNGKKQFVGSDLTTLKGTIQSELKNTVNTAIEISAVRLDSKNVAVHYKVKPLTDQVLNIALIYLFAESSVKRGENKGRQLQHINIVKDFKTVPVNKEGSGTLNMSMEAGWSSGEYAMISYLQQKSTLLITGASKTGIRQK